ncbi:MAG: hypothetical protein H7Y20_10125 [Bryobacteraceae bacterium]|nr:hypothetical protein [Bryobacteraceae bacterium]
MKQSTRGVTRRQVAAAIPGLAPLLAQAPVPATPEGELEAARAQAKQNRDLIRKVHLPVLLEPSFFFRP